MAAGTAALLFFPGRDVLAMGLSFGGLHLAWGIAVALQRQPWAARLRRGGIQGDRAGYELRVQDR